MHRYERGKTLGEGAFGRVIQATYKETGEQVAIKTLKSRCKDFDSMMSLPEVKALRAVVHENIVACKELILDRKGHVHIVFELLNEGNLEALSRTRTEPLSEAQIRSIFYQLLRAVGHMHSSGFMHRDIKPENILIQSLSAAGDIKIKLADLGLAKFCDPASERPHTAYVSTRWYRSPEILLRMTKYGYPSDMWAVGVVMAELVAQGVPLFPGDDEVDQIARVVALRGHPAMVGWNKGTSALKARRVRLPKTTPSSLRSSVPYASLPVLQLLSDLLEMDPARRPSALEALEYPLFVLEEPGNDTNLRSRSKRRFSFHGLDTAQTRDPLSSQWSHASGIGHPNQLIPGTSDDHVVSDRPPEKSSGCCSRVYAIEAAPEREILFRIPSLQGEEDSPSIRFARACGRRPAGHFDLRGNQ